jgi:hypothetical protein
LWKTCQEIIGDKPQNIWVSVSKLSTGSGVTAERHYSSELPFQATTRN